jgi:Probable Zinc-ribbon domain
VLALGLFLDGVDVEVVVDEEDARAHLAGLVCRWRKPRGRSDRARRTLPPVPTLANYPELVAQLDQRTNGPLDPKGIAFASGQRLWWRCPEGPDHLWEAPVRRRTAGHGCPFCTNLRVSITNNLAAVVPEIARQWHPMKNGKLTPRDVVFGTTHAVWCQWEDDKQSAPCLYRGSGG